ncbi:MAG TPA: hypothetical protein VFS39_18475 [Nitrospira sp.]|nr:hypothetical protein [Nitrospira sp.]
MGRIMIGLWLVLGSLSAAAVAAQIEMDPAAMPKSFLSGNEWRGLSKGEQQAYAVGVIDGLELAFSHERQGNDLGWIHACVPGLSSDQARAMLDAELAASPRAGKELTVHQAMYRALKSYCERRSRTTP